MGVRGASWLTLAGDVMLGFRSDLERYQKCFSFLIMIRIIDLWTNHARSILRCVGFLGEITEIASIALGMWRKAVLF